MTNPGSLQVTTPSDREIMMTRDFNASRTLVFDAYTKPELVTRWMFGPDGWSFETCEIDLKVGGGFRYVWRGPDDAQLGMRGVFHEVEPPARIVHTEKYDEDWTGGETQVTTLFIEHDGGTTLTTTIRYASQEARDAALSSGMEEGLNAGYDRLAGVLASAVA